MAKKEDTRKKETATQEAEETKKTTDAAETEVQETDEKPEPKSGDIEADNEALSAEAEQLLRLRADFQNYRRRVEREKADMVRLANEDLLRELIEVYDDFQRAVEAEKEHDAFYEGIQMIADRFQKVLEKNGLQEIPTNGEPFDPNLHHAVITEDADEKSGTIVETFQRGYTLNGKVLRPAMVKVAR